MGSIMRRGIALIVTLLAIAPALGADPFELTGVPPGVTPLRAPLPMEFPAPQMTEGQPVESRAGEQEAE